MYYIRTALVLEARERESERADEQSGQEAQNARTVLAEPTRQASEPAERVRAATVANI